MNTVQRRAVAMALVLFALRAETTIGAAYGGRAAKMSTTRASASTGHLRLSFGERSPLSERDEVLRRIDANLRNMGPNADKASLEYDLATESFEVFVPLGYRPGVPHGLFVWTGVTEVPSAWQAIFSRHKLICIASSITTVRKGLLRNAQLPLDAVHNMKNLYDIDENRVYIGGFSAGGGMASRMVCAFPDVFRGGYFLLGGRFYVTYKNQNGQWETTVERMTPGWKGPLDRIRKDMRLVFMRGEDDTVYSPQEDRGQCEGLLLDGFTRVTYIEVPRLGHELPSALWFEKGIVALDQSKPKTPPTTGPASQPYPLPGQIAQAQRLVATARMWLDARGGAIAPRHRDRAREYLQRVLREYPSTPAAAKARQLLDES
ncbi:MAG: hypothetical protein NTU53_16895 [Planctomycetota bacterium]|nr:hypothetical protein [Planctomycetota bacterium]